MRENIKVATIMDVDIVAELAKQLWQDNDLLELRAVYKELLTDKNVFIVIMYANEKSIGFAQCGLRYDYVEGTCTSPVGYLEGIFIKAEHRLKGYAK